MGEGYEDASVHTDRDLKKSILDAGIMIKDVG
jgi:hypothetical protein